MGNQRKYPLFLQKKQTTIKMKHVFNIIFFISIFSTNAQIGIGTTVPAPSSILDISSNSKGVLMPRLTSGERNSITNPANGLIIFNTDTNQLEINKGTIASPLWTSLAADIKIISDDSDNIITAGSDGGAFLKNGFHIGKFIISSTGSVTITGLPFTPSKITFTAYANIESYTIDDDNDANQNNNNGIANTFGSMTGYASSNGGTIQQQVIFNGGSGASINDISRYASSAHAIGIRYTNNNGGSLGKTTAELTSFNSDGFTLNVNQFADGLVVIFEAHR